MCRGRGLVGKRTTSGNGNKGSSRTAILEEDAIVTLVKMVTALAFLTLADFSLERSQESGVRSQELGENPWINPKFSIRIKMLRFSSPRISPLFLGAINLFASLKGAILTPDSWLLTPSC